VKISRGLGLLALVLIASLAVNLFLAGNQVGQQFHRARPMNFEQRLEALIQTLPDADRPIAQEVVDQHRQDLAGKLRAYRVSAVAAAVAVRAEPFNDETARQAFAKANEQSAIFRQTVEDMVIEIAGKVSPAGREHLRPGIGGP
jgi:uncharacterized membrane protein